MEITLNITEDSKVELVKDSCEAVQGENNITVLKLNFPQTIKGYSINNYAKQIEFGECKELGECKKFFDTLEGNTYKLCSICTQFKKIMIQFTLKNLVDEAEPVVWKTIPFSLEFNESINAENTKEVQATLLSLAEIEKEWADDLTTTKSNWETFIKANAIYVINKVGNVPTADAASLGNTIFYLGANSTSPYTLTYGHYYRCNYVNGAYEWTDLTQDPSIEGVANGIREINNNQTMQIWVGAKEELTNEVTQPNVIYIPEDHDPKQMFDEVLSEMAEDDDYKLAYPLVVENDTLKYKSVPQQVFVEIGGELLNAEGIQFLEMWCTLKQFAVGDTFTYNGDTAEITKLPDEADGEDWYVIKVNYGGAISNASGETIYLDEYVQEVYIIPMLDQKLQVDSNGVLKLGDLVIPQKKLLWSGDVVATIDEAGSITLNDFINIGDTIEVEFSITLNSGTIRAKVRAVVTNYYTTNTTSLNFTTVTAAQGTSTSKLLSIEGWVDKTGNSTSFRYHRCYSNGGVVEWCPHILNIYKIIE